MDVLIDKLIQLKTDISKFYPSIYTHSIPWATEGGKEIYKKNRAFGDKDTRKRTNLYGDDLDRLMVDCQNLYIFTSSTVFYKICLMF